MENCVCLVRYYFNVKFNGFLVNYNGFSTYSYSNITHFARVARGKIDNCVCLVLFKCYFFFFCELVLFQPILAL